MAVHKKYDRNVLGRGLDDIGNGRGLDALIDTGSVSTQGSSNLSEIELSHIEPNPNQPRREFDEEALQELAASIREIGIIQPITLRKVADDRYQIIAGERRWRASQLAGMRTIPAYIRTVEDENVMEMALIENIQREDLNAMVHWHTGAWRDHRNDARAHIRTSGQKPCCGNQLHAPAQASGPSADGPEEQGD